jgi:hypothetical protein
MKIIKTLPQIGSDYYVYMADEKYGVAEVSILEWKAYIEALDVIDNFENEVDRQYREKGYPK